MGAGRSPGRVSDASTELIVARHRPRRPRVAGIAARLPGRAGTESRAKLFDAELAQVFVEIAERRRERQRLDPGRLRPLGQGRDGEVAGRIAVTRDVETPKRCREEDGGEVIGRERGEHGQGRQSAAQREHGLEALAGGHDVGRDAETDAVPEEMTHRAPWRVDGRLVVAGWIEPSAMRAGDLAGEVGDGGDQRRPDLGRRIDIGPVVAAGVEIAERGFVAKP